MDDGNTCMVEVAKAAKDDADDMVQAQTKITKVMEAKWKSKSK